MAGMITRCPKCATAFRISEAHLQSAKGMVRCGNCLVVFNARENIQARPANTKPVSGQHSGKPKTPASSSVQPSASAATATPHTKPTAAKADLFDDDVDDDEAWALELLKDDEDLNIQLKKIVTPEDRKAQEERENKRPLYESAVGTQPSPPQAAAPETVTPKSASKAAAKPPGNKPVKDILAAIEPDALEVSWEDHHQQVKKRVMWFGLSLVALLVLLAQVAWLEFYRLSRVEPFRQGYELVCTLLECELPELSNRKAIATSNLSIRSHPADKNLLIVDVIIQNNAAFEQSFPSLVLNFSDMQNQIVAARRFTPSDYLGGELAGTSHMPINQPIHVGFEIQDPGAQALNYNILVVD